MKNRLLELFRKYPGKTFNKKDLIRHLRIPRRDLEALATELNALVEAGDIRRNKQGRYGGSRDQDVLQGRLVVNQKGFGFVVVGNERPDIFIARRSLKDALHGDTVEVRLNPRSRPDNPSGKIEQVIERGSTRFVGTVIAQDRHHWLVVQPVTPERGIMILRASSVEHTPGQVVVATVVDWGHTGAPVRVRVERVLGAAGDPAYDLTIILAKYDYPERFPEAVERELAELSENEIARALPQRRDLRHLATFTIDPADARDFDDALSIEKTRPGGYRLGIHIADVSHFVRPGTVVDREAFNRGTSVYFTEGVVPMLPEILSAELCSLKPDADRLTMSVLVDLDRRFRVTGFRVFPAVIRSRFRFSYEQAQAVLDQREKHPRAADLEILTRISRKLYQDRAENGSIDFDIPEPQFSLLPDGIPHQITARERLASHRLVEECMLLANRLVAERIPRTGETEQPFVYRIHDEPSRENAARFLDLLQKLNLYHSSTSREITSAGLRDILISVENSPYRNLIENIALRTMAKALYSTTNRGHFGLAFKHYTHFTSPIRRYPDLVVHRLVKLYQGKDREAAGPLTATLPSAAGQANSCEIKAQEAEREYTRLKQLRWLNEHLGETFNGVISGVANFGFFVELADTLVEGLVHNDTLEDDHYLFDDDHYRLRGRRHGREYRLGDPVRIRVQEVLFERQRANFVLA